METELRVSQEDKIEELSVLIFTHAGTPSSYFMDIEKKAHYCIHDFFQ
jgi:hypothetical protein